MKKVLTALALIVALLLGTLSTSLVVSQTRSLDSGCYWCSTIDSVEHGIVSIEATVFVNKGKGLFVPQGSTGSGFFYKKNRVLTNAHVIDGAAIVQVVIDGTKHLSGRVIGFDAEFDLAVIEVGTEFRQPQPLHFGAVRDVGELVLVAGSPRGLPLSFSHGLVSGLHRAGDSIGVSCKVWFIQTSAPINPGNSGGPLLNHKGQVLGINSLKFADDDGLGFAIPSKIVVETVQRLVGDSIAVR